MIRETALTLAFCSVWFLAGWMAASIEQRLTPLSACELAAVAPTDTNVEACAAVLSPANSEGI